MTGPLAWLGLAAGGAIGTLLRYILAGWIARGTTTFPWGTVGVNLIGCLAIGLISGHLDRGALIAPALRVAILIGVLGGFTTFSTFGLETFRLLADAQLARAAGYVVVTNLGGLALVWGGYRLGSLL
ncbi:MAG: fluoride efflux transporter CrcB [Candidatus Eisenbacteria bacterium]|uniref:Fluoride-specific ion channel FluC n=1 Tax=Eiseniibacteriota bacterium TaxID=2212470 RepID=A0A956LWA4_UNCEI|nr:fluoride efflux transporter CrcB [Candidatus Eisenbacteria bacterium]